MKRKLLYSVPFLCLLFSACSSLPPEKQIETAVPQTNVEQNVNNETKPLVSDPKQTPTEKPNTPDEDIIVAQFESFSVTKHIFNITKSEIQLVVDDLNIITNTRDYTRWLTYLSEEYRLHFSDPAVLDKVSLSLPTKGYKLKNLKDYFTYVFVPSRQNMRVDDITFVSPTRVYVIMEIAPKSPAAIYILEKTLEGWKLVLKNQ